MCNFLMIKILNDYIFCFIYLYSGKGAAVGFLRIGHKHLYLSDPSDTQGRILQYEPLCVLDFFIEPEYQRSGFGRRLFDYMLQVSN